MLDEADIKQTALIKGEDASDHEMYIIRDLSRTAEVLNKHFV